MKLTNEQLLDFCKTYGLDVYFHGNSIEATSKKIIEEYEALQKSRSKVK